MLLNRLPHQPVWALQPAFAPRRFVGLLVSSVVPRSPADAAGIRPGDVVVTIDGTDATTARTLQRLMVAEAIGRPTAVGVLRNGALQVLTAVPRELEDAA
jgi:S1-C subfamily serine protease